MKPCSEEHSSFLSKALFSWSEELETKRRAGALTEQGLNDLPQRDKCCNVCPAFHNSLEQEFYSSVRLQDNNINSTPGPSSQQTPTRGSSLRQRKIHALSDESTLTSPGSVKDGTGSDRKLSSSNPSLFFVIMKTFWKLFVHTITLRFMQYLVMWMTNPYFICFLMDHATDPNAGVITGVFLSVVFLFLLMLGSIFSEHAAYRNHSLKYGIHSALITSVFKKSLNLSSSARKKYSLGEITNYMSADCDSLAYHITHVNYVLFTPVHFIVVFYQLFEILGAAAWLGIISVALVMPINAYVTVRLQSLCEENTKYNDKKMTLLNEILTGIKVIKLNAWERCFGEKIDAVRDEELDAQRRYLNVRAVVVLSWRVVPYLISVVMFCGYFYFYPESTLTAKEIFSVISLLNMLRFAINQAPEIIYDVIKARISIKRLERFLNEEELTSKPFRQTFTNEAVIDIRDASFSWDKGFIPTLKRINLQVQKKELIAVVGQVGSGKSSLLSAILGDLERTQGQLFIQGSIGYVSQQAWIQNDSLQNNILFGKDLDRDLYRRVIQACALQPDLDLLPAGDKTEIGERGINLSGGQKQRVSLARAVYNDADIYLLDDPLSAVDSHVGKHIFDQVIGDTGILNSKTRILVTHNLRYMGEVDSILVIDEGSLVEMGPFEELLARDDIFTKVITSFMSSYEGNKEDIVDILEMDCRQEEVKSRLAELKRLSSSESKNGMFEPDARQSSQHKLTDVIKATSFLRRNDEDENIHKISRKEKWSLFLTYCKSFGVENVLGIAITFGMYYVLWFIGSVWLVKWSDDPILKISHPPTVNHTVKEMMWRTNMKYLSVYSGLGVLMSIFIFLYTLLMTVGMLQASRLVHRRLMQSILRCPMDFFEHTSTGQIINRFSTDMKVIDEHLPYTVEFYYESLLNVLITTLAVLYSSSTSVALVIPLAYYLYQILDRHTLRQNALCKLETDTRAPIESYFTECVTGADTIRAFRAQGRVEELLEASGSVGWLVILQSEVESCLLSVERIMRYINTTHEAEWQNTSSQLPQTWHSSGCIEFRNLTLSYTDDQSPVLKDISLSIKSGEKIGLVGRTGAGKSSLVLSLFRLVEAASGAIFIDGVNIAHIGLHDLREKLAIIPQDPVLFNGTLRSNLDPEDQYTDPEIWTALEHAHLGPFVTASDKGLLSECGESGANFSVGQRQLFCLARTLLRKSKILVLDEATAAVDMETDDLIQQTIRSEFKDCTVLTIAHRLNTVMDYDRIIVLNEGKLVEFDAPGALIDIKGSFYLMAVAAGLI